MVRNEEYWGTDADGNRLPYLDEVTIRVIRDRTVLASALRTGEIDVAYLPYKDVSGKERLDIIKLLLTEVAPPRYQFTETELSFKADLAQTLSAAAEGKVGASMGAVSVNASLAVGDLEMAAYDIVYLAGGWGAAFDLGFSEELGRAVTEANELDRVIGGVCHGPLGLLQATAEDGSPLVRGRRVTAVTDKQVEELGIESTPHHPETELRRLGADFESATRFRDPFANHWVVDGNLVTGQNQNAAPMVAREMLRLAATARPGTVRGG